MKNEDITQLRHEYNSGSFSEKNAADSPFDQFQKWFDEAKECGAFPDPNAVIVCTVGTDGMPDARTVLLKEFNERGFVFYSNYQGKKAHDLDANPKSTFLFFWDKLERQIRIRGTITHTSSEEAEKYFVTRSYTSRIGAWASKQSQTLSSRYKLLREVATYMSKYPLKVPLPPHWGGFRLEPSYFEFWQGRPSRLHDRITYTLQDGQWTKQRIYP